MGLQYDISGNQIDGARDYQEDAFLVTHLTDAEGQPSALVIVADGMGGHAAGNVASNMAVQAFNKYVSSNYPSEDMPGLLQGGILKANGSIAETIRETPALKGMGCTIVAILIEQGQLWWASVGDSHLYLLRDKELIKKNADHSYGGFLDRLAAVGQPMDPEPGLSRNMLMSAVTGEEITEIDCPELPVELQHGDRLVLCSDGLDTLSHGKIIQYAEWSEKARDYTQALLTAVEEEAMPRQDNTTAIVVDVISSDAAAIAAVPTQASTGLEIDADGEVDMADLTQPNSSAAAAANATPVEASPIPLVDITATETPAATSDDKQPATAEQAAEPTASRERSITAGRGRFFAIAAAIVVALVVLAYVLIVNTGKDAAVTPAPVTDETEMPPPAITDEREEAPSTIADPIPEPITEPEPAIDPESTAVDPEPGVSTTAEPAPTFHDNLKSGGEGPVMQPIAAGSFRMGSNRFRDERPEHEVTVKPFAISQHEITIAEYERYARATGEALPATSGMNKTDHPVINVTWTQAAGYAAWLSQQTGEQYRLPTEAEWEYAATAGRKTDYWWGVVMEPDRAHCFGCDSDLVPGMPIQVGSYPANPFGLYDMAGNVAEWVQDCWHKNYEDAPVLSNEAWTSGGNCQLRIVRGGSYNSPPTSLRHSRRDKFDASSGYDNIGFRIVRESD